jgi:hypothetical protein
LFFNNHGVVSAFRFFIPSKKIRVLFPAIQSTGSGVQILKPKLSRLRDQISLEALENASYEKSKEEAFAVYDQLLKDVSGNDLAAKERAIKELPSAQNKVAQFNKPKRNSRSTLTAILAKIEFLKSKLHIKQQQQINGFISYFKINKS